MQIDSSGLASRFGMPLVALAIALFAGGCSSPDRSAAEEATTIAEAKPRFPNESLHTRMLDRLMEFEGAFELVRSGPDQTPNSGSVESGAAVEVGSWRLSYNHNLSFLIEFLEDTGVLFPPKEFDQLLLTREGKGCGQQVEMAELAHLMNPKGDFALRFFLANVVEGTEATANENRIFEHLIQTGNRVRKLTSSRRGSVTPYTSKLSPDELVHIIIPVDSVLVVPPPSRVTVRQVPPADSRLICKTSTLSVFKTDDRKLDFLNSIASSKVWKERPSLKSSQQKLTSKQVKQIRTFIKELRELISKSAPSPAS